MITYSSAWGSRHDDVWFGGTGISSDFPNVRHWNGTTLDSLMIHFGMSEVTSLHGTSATDVWAVLGQNYLSVHHFDGSTWTDRTQPFMDQPIFDIWAATNGHVYAVGGEGAIYHFDGTAWTDESVEGETNDFLGVWVDGVRGWAVAVGENGIIYASEGSQWAKMPLGHLAAEVKTLRDVWGSNLGGEWEVFSVGDEGRILRLGSH
jgi:photosystem II stability/assembly factor-like uncharacterized protein